MLGRDQPVTSRRSRRPQRPQRAPCHRGGCPRTLGAAPPPGRRPIGADGGGKPPPGRRRPPALRSLPGVPVPPLATDPSSPPALAQRLRGVASSPVRDLLALLD